MKIGYLGAGNISSQMAATVAKMDEAQNYAVAARDLARAEAFAERWGFERAYGSYEELLADPEVDLVYVALPHSHHHRWTLAALEAGHHVLCEKAFAVNEAQAREMIDRARAKGLLLAEAIWTRYMPSRKIIDDIVASGSIGRVLTVDANLGYKVDMNERMVTPELAGGALLDLTVYPLNFASMVLGDDIARIDAHMVPTTTGVDGQDSVTLTYSDGRMATMFTTMHTMTDRRGLICGTEGFIMVENINNPQRIFVYDADGLNSSLRETIEIPEQITGYEYEVLACKRAIEAGSIECSEMPHAETLELMRQMDAIRAQFGIVYPFE
ncbi:Gfo/Idh/MocA family oxidoreductase [Collinsella tanakaei]|uniref:Gfo/Idh/MocA family protein n=1 Tax=Collinsella tanakaei TaxID=626935 RepID=UPI00195B718D|nr:Gfo/Idh/MocA family oxidoreductase [Collinsella tanakaei]MBM6756344.1 Gfo/Idh/MocA family oxidoreductase [Collinsella tanakaei]